MSAVRSRDEIAKRVIELAAEQVGVDVAMVTEATQFEADLNYDSLDMVDLIMNLEEAFDLSIPDEQAEGVKSVGEAIGLVERALLMPRE